MGKWYEVTFINNVYSSSYSRLLLLEDETMPSKKTLENNYRDLLNILDMSEYELKTITAINGEPKDYHNIIREAYDAGEIDLYQDNQLYTTCFADIKEQADALVIDDEIDTEVFEKFMETIINDITNAECITYLKETVDLSYIYQNYLDNIIYDIVVDCGNISEADYKKLCAFNEKMGFRDKDIDEMLEEIGGNMGFIDIKEQEDVER